MKLEVHSKHKDAINMKINSYKDAVNLYQIEELANRTFNTNTYVYYQTGSSNMKALQENSSDFEKLYILPKILVDVSSCDTSVELLGEKIDIPVCIAPTAMHRLAHFNAEVETARASTLVDTVLCLSSISNVSLAQVAPYAKHKWMQLYVMKDLKKTELFVKLAEKSGYTTLVVTVDAPVMGVRDIENIYKFAGHEEDKKEELVDGTKNKVESNFGKFFNSSFNTVSQYVNLIISL